MTTILINPGSRIGESEPGGGWTNTYTTALHTAHEWLARIHADGMTDVELLPSEDTPREGRWTFRFRHTVTSAVVELKTHGIDNQDAYERQHLFAPRVYWRGSSTSDPQLEDFAADGFELVRTYRPRGGAS